MIFWLLTFFVKVFFFLLFFGSCIMCSCIYMINISTQVIQGKILAIQPWWTIIPRSWLPIRYLNLCAMMLLSIEKPYARIGISPVEHVFNTFLLNLFALKLMATPFFFFLQMLQSKNLQFFFFFLPANSSFYWHLHDLFTLYHQCKSLYLSLQAEDLV